MSRNWYIQTDRRNVQQSFGEIDTTPLSFREKWRKNHKKYILWAVEAVVLLAVLALALPGLFRQEKPDYTVTLVTSSTAPYAGQEWLSNALTAVGEDRDGDGKVEVSVRTIATGEDQTDPQTQRDRLISSFVTSRYTLFAMEPACYERYVQAYETEPNCLFVKLDAPDFPLTAGDTLWEWNPGVSSLPETLWVGVRVLPEQDADQQAHILLLERLMASLVSEK